MRATRIVGVGALVIALVVVIAVLFGPGGDYRVDVRLTNASQLVPGNLVKVAGREIGSVEDIRLDDNNQAELTLKIDDGDFHPLHEGTIATVRATSLSGVANRYVVLTPGPNNRPAIADGGVIGSEDTQSAVDLDEVLNTIDAQTRASLQEIVHGGARTYSGKERQANAGLAALNPAVAQTAATAREIDADQQAFERFVVESAAVVSAVGSRNTDLESGIANASVLAASVARERGSLDTVLRGAPDALRRANTTLVNLRATLQDARPALHELRPVAPRLDTTFKVLDPLARNARPAIGDLRQLLPDLESALRELPRVQRSASPAFKSSTSALDKAMPVVVGARPYVPDLIGGLFNGFGGSTGGYYDANGHYARISIQGSPFALNNSGSLVPVPDQGDGGLSGFRRGVVARCPGAATQPAPDRSNPFVPDGTSCDQKDTPTP
jgi:phospholipid/cholesterol/gamma-HCH transport system substrate-binding protein